MEIDEALPDHLRCSRTDGRRWRCKRRVMDDKKYCEIHFLKIFSGKKSLVVSRKKNSVKKEEKKEVKKEEEEEEEEEVKKEEKEDEVAVPDFRRCSRTDGRKWRCSRGAMDNEKLCEIHRGRGKKGVSRMVSTEESVAVPDLRRRPRCSTIGGQQWRCSEPVMNDKKKPKISRKKGISWRLLMEEDRNLPDHLRCNRTDGRQWRCNRRVVENKKLCEIHHLQGRHRQYKQRVPESLKIQRKSQMHKPSDYRNFKLGGNKNGNWTNLVKRRQWIAISEALDEALKKMKLKKGDLQLELIRMFLQRQVERQKQRNSEANCQGDLMRYLPNGLMAISPALSPLNFDNAGPSCEVKVGVDSDSFRRRCFRSKNIEPLPIGPLKVVPFAKNVANLRRVRKKNCHWCLKRGFQSLIKCSSCKREHFCKDCIKEWYLNSPEEVKVACPVCRGTCSCKECVANQSQNVDCKDLCKDDSKVFDI